VTVRVPDDFVFEGDAVDEPEPELAGPGEAEVDDAGDGDMAVGDVAGLVAACTACVWVCGFRASSRRIPETVAALLSRMRRSG
jgi:hypothetical protein